MGVAGRESMRVRGDAHKLLLMPETQGEKIQGSVDYTYFPELLVNKFLLRWST